MNESLDSMDGLRSKIELCLIAQLMANFFFFLEKYNKSIEMLLVVMRRERSKW